MIVNNNAGETNLIRRFINLGKQNSLNLSNNVNYIKYQNTDHVIPVDGIFSQKYRDHLISVSQEVELTEEEYNKYKYRPKLLSYDLYGTVDYWFILMIINNVSTIISFNLKTIRFIPSESLDILELIMNKEKTYLQTNQAEPLLVEVL